MHNVRFVFLIEQLNRKKSETSTKCNYSVFNSARKEKKLKLLPLKIGAILNTPKPPIVSICPSANSIKNIGIPANMSVKKYGTKKNGAKNHKLNDIVFWAFFGVCVWPYLGRRRHRFYSTDMESAKRCLNQ